jgi:hypothetical protein
MNATRLGERTGAKHALHATLTFDDDARLCCIFYARLRCYFSARLRYDFSARLRRDERQIC